MSFIENIAEVRNICAHDNRLWDFKCRDSVKYYPVIHDAYGIINQQAKSDVYNVYIILQCFISAHKYDILTKTLKKRFKNFESKLHSQSINIFLNSLGFPNDWHLQEPLK
ncbi:Abortive infection bacteriophage resistance protein [Chlamydia trachomatis]|nr:Abortive infection bacteriophage resistance protein [Chlamydia trachomatis]